MSDNILIYIACAGLGVADPNMDLLDKKHQSLGSTQTEHFVYEQPSNKNRIVNKINKFSELKLSEYLEEIPNEFSTETAKKILNIISDTSINIEKVSPLSDGGVVFEFFTDREYVVISVYNNSEIIYIHKPRKGAETIKIVSLDEIKDIVYGGFSASA